MLFNSYEFIFIFLPITFFIYFYLNHLRLEEISKGFLVLTSLFFYSWWNVLYLPIILGSMIFNYLISHLLMQNREVKFFSKKFILMFAIASNIALLSYFKYTDFLIENLNFTLNTNVDLLNLALPLAISFFTFQQISFLVDSYNKKIKEYNFLNYALFVTFFPQLIAGPIVHHKEMMPQFSNKNNTKINHQNISLGLFIFSIGLFKKVIIADTFAKYANYGFNTSQPLDLLESWITSTTKTN
jgi:D-alanyl-lipoteichoic acid acyltransferase DltB (MBOAT superfamily)